MNIIKSIKVKNMNNNIRQLGRHAFMLPSGKMVFLSDNEIKDYLSKNNLKISQPKYQDDDIESMQIGIK